MSEYTIVNGELCHYGVKGMRWGVRRNLQNLRKANASGDKAGHNLAVANLSTHRDKARKKLDSLKVREVKLQKNVGESGSKLARKAAKADAKAAKYLARAALSNHVLQKHTWGRMIRNYNLWKSATTKVKAEGYRAQAAKAKAKLKKNQQLQAMFKKGINDIDRELVERGQDFLYMKPNGTPYTY